MNPGSRESESSQRTMAFKRGYRIAARPRKRLGISDLEGQLSHLKLNSELTKLRLEEARECKVKKGKLYQMLGLSLGITTALLFL